jgi:hypothetical protein
VEIIHVIAGLVWLDFSLWHAIMFSVVEVKKQSSCSIRLTNNTFHNVAFKVWIVFCLILFETLHCASRDVMLDGNIIWACYWQVKTTSPKKYCVRPNVGIVDPKSTFEFIGKFFYFYLANWNDILVKYWKHVFACMLAC